MPTMPNFGGLTVTQAAASRDAAGFSAGENTVYAVYGVLRNHTHKVVFQDPSAGTTQNADVSIALTVDESTSEASADAVIWGH